MSDLNEQGPDEEKVKKAEKAVEDAALKMMNSHPPQFYLLKVGIGETLLSALRAERAKAAELTVEVTKLQSMHDDECYGGIDKTRLQERAESRLKAQGEALAAAEELIREADNIISWLAAIASESEGISGWHRNGDVEPWDHVEEVEMASEWIAQKTKFSTALAKLRAAKEGA